MSPPAVTDLDATDARGVAAAAVLLAQSTPDAMRGLVPYHAPRFDAYLATCLAPPYPLRTVLVRVIVAERRVLAVADWRLPDGGLFLNGLAVREEFRGHGHARALLADGIRLARDRRLATVGLHVAVDNEVAIGLYQRAGFTHTGDSVWSDLLPAEEGQPAQVLDWPTFEASRRAYGFGDVTLRDADGDRFTVRVVAETLRTSADRLPALRTLQKILGVHRVYQIAGTPDPAGAAPFLHQQGMTRRIESGSQGRPQ